MSRDRFLWSALGLLFLGHLMLTHARDLHPMEALLSMAGDRPALYHEFSGPLPPLLVHLGETLLGKREIGARFFAPLLSLLLCWGSFRLGRALGGNALGAWTLTVLAVTPLTHLLGTVISPGGCLATTWVWSMLLFWWAIHRATHLKLRWIATGLCMGIGILCHPLGLLAPLAALLALARVSRWSGRLRSSGPYLMLVACTLAILPSAIWLFGTWPGRTALEAWTSANSGGFLYLIKGGLLWTSPLLCFGCVWALLSIIPLGREHRPSAFALAFALPSAGILLAGSLFHPLDTSLLMLPFVPSVFCLVHLWQNAISPSRVRTLIRSLAIGVAAVFSLSLAQTDLLRSKGIELAVRSNNGINSNPLSATRGWRSVGEILEGLTNQASREIGHSLLLISDNPQMAAITDFYLEMEPQSSSSPIVHVIPSAASGSPYARWPRYDGLRGTDGPNLHHPTVGADALFVRLRKAEAPLPAEIATAFESVHLATVAIIHRGVQPVQEIEVYACTSYRGEPL